MKRLRITKLRTAIVEANFQWTYVRIYSDAPGGLYGTGECFFGPGLAGCIQEFEAILVGEEVFGIERLVVRMRLAAIAGGTADWFQPGWVTPTARPGFGVELDETVGRSYRLPGSAWFDDVRP